MAYFSAILFYKSCSLRFQKRNSRGWVLSSQDPPSTINENENYKSLEREGKKVRDSKKNIKTVYM